MEQRRHHIAEVFNSDQQAQRTAQAPEAAQATQQQDVPAR
jgi:hypothetical protein